MNTNYQMLVGFEEWMPARTGVLTKGEILVIDIRFRIRERTDVELQNLRDFVVMYYSIKMDDDKLSPKDAYRQMDKMSSIVGVIDMEKNRRGLEV